MIDWDRCVWLTGIGVYGDWDRYVWLTGIGMYG